MNSLQAPSWAFTAEAIDAVGDTHLPPGIHVRALPSAGLGLPATPLVVYRTVITPDHVKRHALGQGVIWVDSHNNTLTAPFDVTPDNPVYGYFPLPDVLWAELNAVPATLPSVLDGLTIKDLVPTAVLEKVTSARLTPLLTHLTRVAQDNLTEESRSELYSTDAMFNPTATLGVRSENLRSAIALPRKQAPLFFEAITQTAQGPAAFQTRHQAPYTLAAWTIPLVRVSGQGRVNGIRYLPAERLKEFEQQSIWGVWSLPVTSPGPRYTPTSNAQSEAKDRVQRAAVLRQPMHVAYGASAPSTAPSADGNDAFARVLQVEPEVQRWLNRLLHDFSAPPWALKDDQSIQGQASSNVAVPIEPFLLAGAVDPDLGHYLGFGDVDLEADAPGGALVIYRIRGVWRWDPQRWHKLQVPAFASGQRQKIEQLLESFPELKKFDIVPKDQGPFVDLYTQAVALVGSPPDAPRPVRFTAAEDRGWLAEPPPPKVRRALRLLATGFNPRALAALAATDLNGFRTLHPFVKIGRVSPGQPLPTGTPLPLVVSRPAEALTPGEGRFEDRDAAASAVDYQLAQGDWFGRWSGWTYFNAPDKARTVPMKPTLEIFPHTSTLLNPIAPGFPNGTGMPNPVPNGNIAGTIEVRIPIPRIPDLPAGGAELMRLDLVETFAGQAPVVASYQLASLVGASIELHTAPAHDLLIIKRTGPALPRGGDKKVSYTARWVDSLNHSSADADPAARTITDPRPPPAPAVITELRYTARPDVEGYARVDLDFSSTVGTQYRVFATNEVILLKALDNLAAQAAINPAAAATAAAAAADIRSAQPGAPRAMKFRLYKHLFDWEHFENLTQQPIVATASTTRFVHRVSGALEVLAIYRVLGESATGVLSEMTAAELVPFAVPNLGGPQQPQISILNSSDPTNTGVMLRVKVPRGRAVPSHWRVRRSSVPVSDPMRMGLVANGAVTGTVIERDGTSFDISVPEALAPWRQYQFAVEVQAAPPPGSPTVGVLLPGEWSQASACARLAVIPPNPPTAPSSVVIASVSSQIQITLHHPAADSLNSTVLGDHQFEVWRVQPGVRPVKLDLLFTRGSTDTWVATDPVSSPAGTYITVRIIDPVGRRSEATPSNQL